MSLSSISPSLLVRCQKGDLDSFETLFGRIKEDLYRIIYSFTHDHDDTDEIMQESLIRIYRHFNALKKVEKFPSWVMRIVVNQCHTHRSRKGRHLAYTPIDDLCERDDIQATLQHGLSSSPRERMIRQEVAVKIESAIDELPKRQRTALLLFEIEGLSIREIAQSMQCSEGAVKFNIHQARKKLQQSLSGEWSSLKRTLAERGPLEAAGSSDLWRD